MSGTVNQTYDELELAPGADTPFAFTVPGAALPYLLEWFADVKKPGEQSDEFLLRILIEMAVGHRRRKLEAAGDGVAGSGDGLHAEQRANVTINYNDEAARIIAELTRAAIEIDA